MSTNTTREAFVEMVKKARQGEVQPLHRYLNQLYQDGKRSLLKLTGSEAEAEEYFATAIARFWEKFIHRDEPLPETNIGGYIYTMARFLCLDQKRRTTKLKITTPLEPEIINRKELAENPKIASEEQEAAARENLRRQAMQRALARLTDKCRDLFQVVLETGLEKPRELFEQLGLENARAVTVLRYDCTKQLKVKAAAELELLMQEGH